MADEFPSIISKMNPQTLIKRSLVRVLRPEPCKINKYPPNLQKISFETKYLREAYRQQDGALSSPMFWLLLRI